MITAKRVDNAYIVSSRCDEENELENMVVRFERQELAEVLIMTVEGHIS